MTTVFVALEGLRRDAQLRLAEGDVNAACQLERTAARLIRRAREAA